MPATRASRRAARARRQVSPEVAPTSPAARPQEVIVIDSDDEQPDFNVSLRIPTPPSRRPPRQRTPSPVRNAVPGPRNVLEERNIIPRPRDFTQDRPEYFSRQLLVKMPPAHVLWANQMLDKHTATR